MKESKVQHRLMNQMRKHRWKAWPFSLHRSMPAALAGWCDAVFVRWDHVWFIECKGSNGIVSEAQLEFQQDIKRNSGPHVDHCFVWPDTPLDEIIHWGAEFRPHDTEYPP